MANGGHICCVECTYNRATPGTCDVFGVETHGGVLCRTFRLPKQSHTDARRKWPLLGELEPGTVYAIDNSTLSAGIPEPSYRVTPVRERV